MADKTDVLLEYWKDQRTQARHAESQRATLTNIILFITVATLGFVAQRGLRTTSLSLTIPLIAIGLFGAATSAKYYERYNLHIAQAIKFSELLAGIDAIYDHESTLMLVRAEHADRNGRISRIRLNKLWIAIHLLVALTGCALTVAVLA